MDRAGFVAAAPARAPAEIAYLERLAADTWRCLETLAHTETGLPHDSSVKGEFTSVSNIGFLLTDLSAARCGNEMGRVL